MEIKIDVTETVKELLGSHYGLTREEALKLVQDRLITSIKGAVISEIGKGDTGLY